MIDLEYLSSFGLEGDEAEELLGRLQAEIAIAERRRIEDKYSLILSELLPREGALRVPAAKALRDYEFAGEDFAALPAGLEAAVADLKRSAPYLFEDRTAKKDEGEVYTFVGISPAEACDSEVSGDDITYSELMRRRFSASGLN